MEEKSKPRKQWYRLDNAAKIFPGQDTGRWSNVFRFTAVLKEQVQPAVLQGALRDIMPRFPQFKVCMKNGFFWHYLAENDMPAPPLLEDIKNPCHRVKFKENDGYLLRVYYLGNRVSVDYYHSLCDGHGGAVFLCSLLGRYYERLGEVQTYSSFVRNSRGEVTSEETEDSFAKYANSHAKIKRSDRYVYHPRGTKMPAHTLNITSGILSFDALHTLTAQKGVTVTEYLASVLLQVHIEKQRAEHRKQKEVCIQVPVDLRRVFGSDTLRNFTVCLRTKVDPNGGEYSFDELLRRTSLQLRLANDRHDLNALITANLKIERNALLKRMPLPVKDLGTRISFRITGEQTTTALLTNLGNLPLPDSLAVHVERMLFMPGPGIRNAARVGVVTLGDNLVITFANAFTDSDIERAFFTFLVKQGLHVKIESNRE